MVENLLPELKAFDATARFGGMSAAARALGLRQPTISAHIARLEKHYGVELFHRRGRQVQLTDFGRNLREITNRIFRAEEDARSLLLAAQSQFQGRLSLCAVGPYNVVPMISRFREDNPYVEVSVSMGDSSDVVERILDYRGDLGVLVHRVDDPRIHCVPFRKQPLLVFAHRAHPLAHLASVGLRDLASQSFVVRESGSTTQKVFNSFLQGVGIKIKSSVEIGSREAVREAVAAGLGLGIVSETAYVEDPRLVRLKIEEPLPSTYSHVICLKERSAVPLVARFLEVVLAMRQQGEGKPGSAKETD